MKRRAFLKGSITAAVAGSFAAGSNLAFAADAREAEAREYYELRAYRLANANQHDALDQFLKEAAIPALNRAGAKTVGVFTEIEPKENPSLFVLIPYPSLNAFAGGVALFRENEELRKAAADYIQTPKNTPAFKRIDTWLLHAFTGMPKLELPSYSKEKRDRIFELRTYESYSEEKALRKIDMFNDGEIDIMREVGLAPVFYGQALVGANLPHLTYMLSGENRDAHKKHWSGFTQHPGWKKISGDSRYADTVSKITNIFLKPTDYSQI